MTARKRSTAVTPAIVKAQVSLPAPGTTSRFMTLANKKGDQRLKSLAKRALFDMYYAAYKGHPIVFAAINKRANVSTMNGFTFVPEEPEGKIDPSRARELRSFFRRSGGRQLIKVLMRDIDIYGECAVWVEKTRGGKPWRARRLHPKYLDPIIDGVNIAEWAYGPVIDAAEPQTFKADEVIHWKDDDPNSDIAGLSKLHPLLQTVATDLYAIEYNGSFFENAAQTGTVFLMKNSSEDEVNRNREWLKEHYTGSKNAHKPLIVEGDVEVKKSVSSPREMEFINGRKLNRQDILAVLGVPPDKLGIMEDANRSSGKESDNTFRTEEIGALQSLLAEGLNDQLILVMYGWDDILFKFNESSLRDQLDLMKLFTEAIRMGVFTINFVRGLLGLEPVEGGDKPFVQTSTGLVPLAPLEDVALSMIERGAGGNAPQPPADLDPFTGMPVDGDGGEDQ